MAFEPRCLNQAFFSQALILVALYICRCTVVFQNISQSEAVQKLSRGGQTGFLSMLLFKSAYIVAVGKTDAGKYEIRLKLYFIVCVCNKLSLAHSG